MVTGERLFLPRDANVLETIVAAYLRHICHSAPPLAARQHLSPSLPNSPPADVLERWHDLFLSPGHNVWANIFLGRSVADNGSRMQVITQVM